MEFTDEAIDFNLDFTTRYEENLTEFVTSEGMSVGEVYFMGSSNEKGPLMAVVEMLCE